MSYSMGSIDCIAIKMTKNYFEALKKDLEILKDDPSAVIKDEDQLDMFKSIQKDFEDNQYEDYDEYFRELFDCGVRYYDGGKGSENFAYAYPINLDDGTMSRDNSGDFNGYVYEFSWGSSSIYQPEFKDKKDFLTKLKKELYIPTTFDIEKNVIFLTGVWCG